MNLFGFAAIETRVPGGRKSRDGKDCSSCKDKPTCITQEPCISCCSETFSNHSRATS